MIKDASQTSFKFGFQPPIRLSPQDPFEFFLHQKFPGIRVVDLELANTPGYWRHKTPCGGRQVCKQPLHSTLFDSPCFHTIHFAEFGARDHRGRYVSPYRAWRRFKLQSYRKVLSTESI